MLLAFFVLKFLQMENRAICIIDGIFEYVNLLFVKNDSKRKKT